MISMKAADIAALTTTVAALGSVAFSLALGSASLGMGYVMVGAALVNGTAITCGQFFGRRGGNNELSGVVSFDSGVGVISAEKSSPDVVVGASAPA